MPERTELQRFMDYATTFEIAHASGDLGLLRPHFHPEIEHVVTPAALGCDHDRGCDAVVEGFRRSVLDYDRRFEVRIPEIVAGPMAGPDGVWMRFALTLRSAGLPDLVVEGEHQTRFAAGAIRLIEETLPPDTNARVEAFLAEHGHALRATGAPRVEPGARDRADQDAALARTLLRVYANAKLQRDVAAALDVCSDDFVLENDAFGSRGSGREAVSLLLASFFHAFPDYDASLEGMATSPGHVVCWGDVRISFQRELAGITPTGKTATLPYVSLFDVAGGRLARERFVIDRAELCLQTGIAPAELAEASRRSREVFGRS